ncbi:flavodoxin domain-containing protein [Alkaliphilus hydrothermalis]|uniref:Menaquinone-dependent protoporphyrinogen oxidase n=1 Tax=Alkaliphilus hydrothermalis TaxID=1482730 RepID=A0ABS2NR75_9FIRM|nr:flavodoxin domain-containing protein [Alkaliphilus hydrothermalis]MBM7615457.1 menaquinone-dependent protoporphyrinogen oxidase [Alkaliphilus hydrothermalis]
MQILILFTSKYGATEKALKLVAEGLKGQVDMIDIEEEACGEINQYDTIIFGGSIYVGKIQSKIIKFMEKHKKTLIDKNIALLISSKDGGEKISEFLEFNYPQWIVEQAFIKEGLGYEISIEKMSFYDKFVLKNLFKIEESDSKINYDVIKKIIDIINQMEA